ncbi:hypothetical protein YDYSY3_57590 [Paenibacillus chitinolyticus]|uniref:dUTP diphosphatase n=1 Tax=Paenibacillus chitinolyticus TaxID=79263 RepID=UPI0026E4F07A|nr:dUTP diphosphatase [Paenibacillus chitinolyticus]GKS14759.1 hypothetical protein YDYSY3_57590 [Paenibacillus chitinolyticus]
MKIAELYEMQKALDARIIEQKGLQGVDLLPNTVLALQVEIAELANEWRGFKHWSTRQTPTVEMELCDYCREAADYTRPTPFMADVGAQMCKGCWDMTKTEYAASDEEYIGDFEDYPHFPKKEPKKLLEEYADCLHFFLSIARQLELTENDLFVPDDFLEGDTVINFTELLHHVGQIQLDPKRRHSFFRLALFVFYTLGDQKFGFSYDQITSAYVAKNKTNYDRLAVGY